MALSCPECDSTRLYKDGLRYLADGSTVQRWLCRNCGYRFSGRKKSFKNCQTTNRSDAHQKAVLMEVEKQIESGTAGATAKPTQADIKGKIIEFAWYMKKQGYSEDTINTYARTIRRLADSIQNLTNTEAVKEYLAKRNISQIYKHNIIAAYTLFLKTHGLKWEPPRCNVTRQLPFIPTERELDDLIAGCGKKTAAYLQMLKETAMRMGEAAKLKWKDIDLERRIIVLNDTEKNSNPRIFKISNKLANMLAAIPKTNEYVWGTNSKITRGSVFYRQRKKIARKLGNPRLLRIGLHTFRHWKATMLYHETKNPVLVKEFLGHKTLDTTLLYIQTEKALFKEETDSFEVKAVKNPDEIKGLLETGFEYVCEKDGLMFFRKRK